MANRKGGFIGQDGLNAPNEPTDVSASAGDESASVSFTASSDVGGAAVSGYRVTDSTGAFGASGSASPITVTGLTNGSSYTFRVWAINPFGWSSPSEASESVTALGDRALFTYYNGTRLYGDTFNISTTGNSTDFGNTLITSVQYAAGVSSYTRAVVAADNGTTSNAINYTTIATTGTWASFGRLSSSANSGFTGASNATKGFIFGGWNGSSATTEMAQLTIATLGNASAFGSLTVARWIGAGCSSSVRALFAGGWNNAGSAGTNVIDYVTFASAGNAIDFGDLTQLTSGPTGTSSATRALFGGGYVSAYTNVISYATIATTGNATDFGDLTVARDTAGATANSTRAVFGGGNASGVLSNVVDYVTMASTGNATDFGDLISAQQGRIGMSQCHGGLA